MESHVNLFTLMDLIEQKSIDYLSIQNEYAWKEGSFSCDCNRALAFGMCDASEPHCSGTKRYIITHINGIPIDFNEWNAGYSLPLNHPFVI